MLEKHNLTGKTFSKFKVISLALNHGKRQEGYYWWCECACTPGKLYGPVFGVNLRSGRSKSCGCLGVEIVQAKHDLVGRVFGRLTVKRKAARIPSKPTGLFWWCECSCDSSKTVGPISGANLRLGRSKSCGCLQVEIAKAGKTHGMSYTVEYKTWAGMWDRCTNPTNKNYPRYLDRCPPAEWRSFEVFYAELGPKPSPKHSLERVRNSEPYGPGNVKWATSSEQANNKSTNVILAHDGVTKTASQWAKQLGVPAALFQTRSGKSVQAVLDSVKKLKKLKE